MHYKIDVLIIIRSDRKVTSTSISIFQNDNYMDSLEKVVLRGKLTKNILFLPVLKLN